MKLGVVVFPGSNCDHDAYSVAKNILGCPTEYLWHKEHDLRGADVIILPGGFSFGDYLRCGAIASHSPIMREVVNFANRGGIVMGICNGFQMLTEVGLLPGVLLRNQSLRFICEDVYLKVEQHSTIFTSGITQTGPLRIPIAHGDGNYYAEPDELQRLEDKGQVLFRYVDANGNETKASNPNGSMNNIAGIINQAGNVMGMMPHPERACDATLGQRTDGLAIFSSLVSSFAQSKAA